MSSMYFVRHAQPEHSWKEDRTRPLTDTGLEDSKKVLDVLKNLKIDNYISSPYVRSFNTTKESAKFHDIAIITDERLREEQSDLVVI
jgi:2,3-bisphosphoglycerate-dependent phosphoglycerate mutase